MSDHISPAEQARRAKLRQGRSPEAQLARRQKWQRELNEKQNKAIREQLALQRRQGENVRRRA